MNGLRELAGELAGDVRFGQGYVAERPEDRRRSALLRQPRGRRSRFVNYFENEGIVQKI